MECCNIHEIKEKDSLENQPTFLATEIDSASLENPSTLDSVSNAETSVLSIDEKVNKLSDLTKYLRFSNCGINSRDSSACKSSDNQTQAFSLDKLKDVKESLQTIETSQIETNEQFILRIEILEKSINSPKDCNVLDVEPFCNKSPSRDSLEDSNWFKDVSLFDDLPTELQYKILSYLTPSELCTSVVPVCRRWRQLAYEPILWQRLQFGIEVPIETVLEILERSPLVRWLGLYHDVSVLVDCLVNCQFLHSLDLGFCSGVSSEVISRLVTHCPLVESLNVEACRSVDDGTISHIVGWKKLRQLNLSHCVLVRDEGIKKIAYTCEYLQELNVDGIEVISDVAPVVLVQQRYKTLRKLYLDGDVLTDVTYKALAQCSNLEELSISFAELMSDQGLMAIRELTGLHFLKIKHGSELSESSLRALFEGNHLSHLTHLDLSSCSNLDDVGVNALTKCCSELKILALAWCWEISDKGLEAIVNKCRCLVMMDLVGLVKITGACLAKIPENLPHLTFLDLQQCSRIIDDIVEGVVRQKPNLKVLNYYGEEFSSVYNSSVASDVSGDSQFCEVEVMSHGNE